MTSSFPPPPSPATRTSADFLTLVAGQERRVLELREDLAKAETELNNLKKRWATFEANKKRDQMKQNKLLVNLDEIPGSGSPRIEEVEEERKRRRALVEMSNNGQTHGASTTALGRRGSKRIFEGRHTRTLSLLSPTSKNGQQQSSTSINDVMHMNTPKGLEILAQEQDLHTAQPMSEGIIPPETLQFGFGKTYKDLAAHRKSLSPVAADIFMKQGKQMVDGVREGLWTFFEDMRQATVGEEAISGGAASRRTPRPTKSNVARTKSSSSKGGVTEQEQRKDDSFWKEFGLDTPHKLSESATNDLSTRHIQQKSSTDSQNPPELLSDIRDSENEVDEWDAWESPRSSKQDTIPDGVVVDGDGLPWPILKSTPSKLTRTAGELLHERRDDPNRDRMVSTT